MKTRLESKNSQETLRQREAEILTNFVQHNPQLSRVATEALAKRYAQELKVWSKTLFHQNSGRSSGLDIHDYEFAANHGLLKAALDYDIGRGTSFKSWLYTNVFSFCNDLAKKNERHMKIEVEESRFSVKEDKDSNKPKLISIDELTGDEHLALSAPWAEYNRSSQIAARIRSLLQKKTAESSATTQKKAQRVLEFIEHVENGGNKVSFAEKTGCSRTTLDSNINFFLEGDSVLKEMAS